MLSSGLAAAQPPSAVWNYVGRPQRPMQVKLPPPFKTCDDAERVEVTGSATVHVWTTSATDATARNTDKAAQCKDAPRQAVIKVVGPALRSGDVKEFAFDWDGRRERELDVHLQLARAVDEEILRSTVLRLVGSSDTAGFQGYDASTALPLYRFKALDASVARVAGQLRLAPNGAPEEVRDPDTGEIWEQLLQADPRWLVNTTPGTAIFMRPQKAATTDPVRAVLPSHALNRFLRPEPVACVDAKLDCVLSHSETGWFVETQFGRLGSLVATAVELPVSTTLVRAAGRVLGAAKLTTKLAVTECVYELTQLTRVEAGRTQAQTLLSVQSSNESPTACMESDWDAALKRPGSPDIVATGSAKVAGKIATVAWHSTPAASAATTYTIEFKYRSGGQVVAMSTPPKLVVDAAVVPLENLRAFTTFEEKIPEAQNGLVEVTPRKALASDRQNRIDLGGAFEPSRWNLRVVGASSFFPRCDGKADGPPPLCVKPQNTDEPLKILAIETVVAKDALLPGVDPSAIPDPSKPLALGTIEFSTGLSAKPYRVALNLEEYLKVYCGTRVIGGLTGGAPISVDYDAFDHCEVVFDPRSSGRRAVELLARSGDQSIEVSGGRVPTDGSAPKLEVLGRLRLGSGRKVRCAPNGPCDCLSFRLNIRRASGGDAGDYAIVQIEAKHVAEHYEISAASTQHQSTLVVRVRRRPEFLAPAWGLSERTGPRFFFTFTVTPFTLFRAPHSGRNVWKSSDAAKLESANFGAGFFGVGELWNFDRNAPALPFLAPQIQLGILSTTPSPDSLDYPVISLVGGLGIRTGVDTAPDAKIESAVKFLFWLERLFTFDDRRDDATTNVLFGFGVDVGSFGN